MVNQFVEAFQSNKQQDMLELISEKVTLYSDGGGKVKAALRPIFSNERVSAFLYGIKKKSPQDLSIEEATVNGQPGLVCYLGTHLYAVISFNIQQEVIHEIYLVLNPDKLSITNYRTIHL